MDYYVNVLKYYSAGQSFDYLYSMADGVVQIIEQNELVRQGAEALGISVSDAEIDAELEKGGQPTSIYYRDLVGAELLVTKLKDQYFEYQVPSFAEQVRSLFMFLESESQALEVRARLEAGGDFGELAGELSLDGVSKEQKGDLDWRPKDVLAGLLKTSVPGEYAFNSEVGVLSPPVYDEARTKSVGYWLIKVLERKTDSEQAHIQGILLGSEVEAQGVRAQLEAGGNFAALAKELSQHESKKDGGDLGWVSPGTMSSSFDKVAFNSEVELRTLSEPVRDDTVTTTGGYWLVKVLEKDDARKVEGDNRSVLKSNALNGWVSSLRDNPDNKVESYLDNDQKGWAIARVMGS
jgi:parvulin-like peptidyl-prolyl isomerase